MCIFYILWAKFYIETNFWEVEENKKLDENKNQVY